MNELRQQQFGPTTVLFGEKNGKYPDGNQVLVRGRESLALFDTPLSTGRLLSAQSEGPTGNMASHLRSADMVLLGHVHEDHVCALGDLPDVPVYAPQADLEAVQSLDGLMLHFGYSPEVEAKMRHHVVTDYHYVPRPDAQGYADGTTWDLGGCTVRAIHMPGHTSGHSVLMVESSNDAPTVAYLGDIDLTGFGPYYGDATSDLRAFQETLAKIPDLDADLWITFHHKGVVTDREEMLSLLRKFSQRLEARHDAIHMALSEQPRTLQELVAHRFLYPRGQDGIFFDDAERKTIQEHLALLQEEGRATVEEGVYRAL